jgi:tRNA A37 threonylcarbamoyladenosine dehydratase
MIDLFPVDKADFPEPVIVTGAGGCIGSWVLHLLQRSGC